MRIVTSILLTASVLAIWCQPASAQTSLGYSSYTAKVQANGSVTDSNGVQSTAKNGVGLYTVTFSRPLIDCVFLGTITSNNPGMISVIRINTNSVRVSTFSSGGAPRDSAFVVLVSCAS